MKAENVKQNEKAKELFSIERARGNLKKNNETKINSLPDKEFKASVIKMLTELGKIFDVHSEHFKKELENIKKTQSEIKNSVAEITQ